MGWLDTSVEYLAFAFQSPEVFFGLRSSIHVVTNKRKETILSAVKKLKILLPSRIEILAALGKEPSDDHLKKIKALSTKVEEIRIFDIRMEKMSKFKLVFLENRIFRTQIKKIRTFANFIGR